MTNHRRQIRRLRVNRIDLVDRGAQPDAHIAIYKRHAGPTELDRLIAHHQHSGVSKAEATRRALDQRPDLFC